MYCLTMKKTFHFGVQLVKLFYDVADHRLKNTLIMLKKNANALY